MKCPRCETISLKAEELNGLSVDACPDCQGVWVRKKDLKGLLEGRDDDDEDRGSSLRRDRGFDSDDEDVGDKRNPKRKRGGWLQNIGDMFGGD